MLLILGANMILFKKVEELNELLIRNKDMSMLLNEKDRRTLDSLINEISEKDIDSNLLKTILGLQVYIFLFLNNYRIFNTIISGE